MAGANKSARVMHQRTFPLVRAATPAPNEAAAAPSTAPLPPPAISCNAPSARPPPGSRESTSVIPNGRTDLARLVRPSIRSICARKESMAGSGRKLPVDLRGRVRHHVLYLFSILPAGVKLDSMRAKETPGVRRRPASGGAAVQPCFGNTLVASSASLRCVMVMLRGSMMSFTSAAPA